MAKRRMFSLDIVDSDAFLSMSSSAQLLYFHLGMRADDDGIVGNPVKIARVLSLDEDAISELITSRFILEFGGIVVIKHWGINNTISKDRYKETTYREVKNSLAVKQNKSYTEKKTDTYEMGKNYCEQNVNNLYTKCSQNVYTGKYRLGKIRLDKDRKVYIGAQEENLVPQEQKNVDKSEMQEETSDIIAGKIKYGEFGTVLLTQQEYETFIMRHTKRVALAAIKELDEWQEKKQEAYPGSHLAALQGWPLEKAVKALGYDMGSLKPTAPAPPEKWILDRAYSYGTCTCGGTYYSHYTLSGKAMVMCEICGYEKPKDESHGARDAIALAKELGEKLKAGEK